MKLLKLSPASAVALLALAGCQAVYPTQYVPSSPLTVEYKSDSYDFKVVDLTPTAALEANQVWSYTPRPVPAGLRADAQPQAGLIVRATSLGEDGSDSPGKFITAEVSDNVDGFTPANYRDPPQSPAQPYRVGVGDIFTVTIESVDNGDGLKAFQRETTVDYAGNIYLTDVGEVQVLDLTVSDARQVIADRFRDARLSASGSATVTGFNSQKVLIATPGKQTSFLPVTNTPVTLREAYLKFSSGIDRDAKRQAVVLRRDGREYSMPAINVLRQSYGYDVYLRDKDEIQIFDESLIGVGSAAVAPDVLALQQADLDRRRFDNEQQRFQTEQQRFEAAETRADRAEQRAAEAAQLARENAEFARRTEARAAEQLEIARLNAQIAQSADARAQLDQARADREDARRDAAESRASAAEARARAAEARADAQAAREDAAAQRAARQLQLTEDSNRLAEQTYRLNEQGNTLSRDNAARDSARSRINLGIEQQDRVFIGGEVGKQQSIPMPFERQFTLAEVIYGADGVEPITGDPERIYVVRVKSSVAGSVESYIFNFDHANLANTAAMTMFQMRPNDYVVVLPRAITNWSRFITQLVPTLNSVISAARLGV